MRNLLRYIFILFASASFAQEHKLQDLDPLVKDLSAAKKAHIYDSVAGHFTNNDPSYAIACASEAMRLLDNDEQSSVVAHALSNRAKAFRTLSDFDKAIADLDHSYSIYSRLKDKGMLSSLSLDYGNLYYYKGEYKKSTENYLAAMRVAEELKDSKMMALCENNLGNIYLLQQLFDKAIASYQRSHKFYRQCKDTARAALCLDNIGLTYYNMEQYDLAMLYQVSAMQQLESIRDPEKRDVKSQAEVTMNIGVTSLEQAKYESALSYFEKAYKLYESIGSRWGMAGCLVNMGEAYSKQKKYPEAIKALNRSIAISDSTGGIMSKRDAIATLSDVYQGMGDSQKALELFKQYTAIKDSLMNVESTGQINELSAKYESEKKQKEIELLTKDKDLSDYRFRATAIGLALILLLLVLLVFRVREKQKANRLLQEKNHSINEQKELISIKNQEITDSINYAKRIQEAMLPSHKILHEYFRDNFVFYQPKDIISGDFYWATRKNDQLFIAAADCTGHGVPGALMSMIGISFLRQIINEMNITEPSQVLNKLHEMVLLALNEDVSVRDSKDGMDIALLRVDIASRKATFSGAVRPLWISGRNGFSIIKGDRYSVGGIKTLEESFSQTDIELAGPTSFYMFSDGYADQFGAETGKKFMVKNLQRLLESGVSTSMEEQERQLRKAFQDWKGAGEQTDDVMVIGLRV